MVKLAPNAAAPRRGAASSEDDFFVLGKSSIMGTDPIPTRFPSPPVFALDLFIDFFHGGESCTSDW